MRMFGNYSYLCMDELLMLGFTKANADKWSRADRQLVEVVADPDDKRVRWYRIADIGSLPRSRAKLDKGCRVAFDFRGNQDVVTWLEAKARREEDARRAAALTSNSLPALRQAQRRYYQVADFNNALTEFRLTKERAAGIATSAAWLDMIASQAGKYDVQRLGIPGISDKNRLKDLTVQALSEDKPYGLQHISSVRTLQQRLTAWKKGLQADRNTALASLMHQNWGKTKDNKKLNNAAKLMLMSLYLNWDSDVKLLPQQIHDAYCAKIARGESLVDTETGELLIPERDLKPLSLSSVKTYLRSKEVQAVASKYRDGSKFHNDQFRPYVKGQAPRYSLSLTSSDGEHVPFRLKISGKETYKRAVCYLIFDAHSQAVVGWAIGMGETKELMQAAFRNMVLATGGVLPLENQLDNFGQSMAEELREMFDILTFCEPYHPQSKYAETLIGRFEQQQLRRHEGWLGGNIQDRKQVNKRNPDIKTKSYTLGEINALYAEAIEQYNNTCPQGRNRTRAQILQEDVNPDAYKLSATGLAMTAGYHTRASIVRGYITIEVDSVEYTYEVSNYEQVIPELQNGWKVRVRYLRDQLDERIWIFNYDDLKDTRNDRFLAECLRVEAPQRAKAEQTDIDAQRAAHMHERIGRFDRWVEEKASQVPTYKEVEDAETDPAEAEARLADGYTAKADMYDAEAHADTDNPTQKDKSKPDKKTQRLKLNRWA